MEAVSLFIPKTKFLYSCFEFYLSSLKQQIVYLLVNNNLSFLLALHQYFNMFKTSHLKHSSHYLIYDFMKRKTFNNYVSKCCKYNENIFDSLLFIEMLPLESVSALMFLLAAKLQTERLTKHLHLSPQTVKHFF